MPKRKAPAGDESRKKPKSQAGTSKPQDTAGSSIDNEGEQTRTAAARFMAVSELRRYLFEFLDKPSLARMARVEKGLTYDVAQVLYRTVSLRHLRFKMSRSSARRRIYCDAVRWVNYSTPLDDTLSLELAFDDFDATTVGQSSPRPQGLQLLVLIEIARKKCPYTRGIEQNYGVLGEGFRVIFDPAGRSGEIVCQHRCFYTNGDMVCEFPWSHPSLDGFVEAPRWTSLVLPETDENDDLRSLQLPGKIVQLESRGQSATPMFLTKVLQKLRNNGDDLSKLNELVCPELPHALSPLIDFFQSMQLGRLTVLRLDTESRIFDYRRIVAGSLPADDFPAFVTSIAESLPLLQELSIGLLYTPTCTSTFLRSGMHLLRPRYAKLTIRIQYEIECVEGPWLAVALLAYLQDPEKTDGLSLRLSGRCHSVGVCVIQGVKRFAPEMVLLMAADRLLFYDLCRDAFESPNRSFTGDVDIVKREFERMYDEKHRHCTGDSHNHLD